MTTCYAPHFVDEQILIYISMIRTLEQGERTDKVAREIDNLHASIASLARFKQEQISLPIEHTAERPESVTQS